MRCTVALSKNLKRVLLEPFQKFGSQAVRLPEVDGEPPLVTFSFFKVVSAQAHTTTVIPPPPGLDGSYHETHGYEEPGATVLGTLPKITLYPRRQQPSVVLDLSPVRRTPDRDQTTRRRTDLLPQPSVHDGQCSERGPRDPIHGHRHIHGSRNRRRNR